MSNHPFPQYLHMNVIVNMLLDKDIVDTNIL